KSKRTNSPHRLWKRFKDFSYLEKAYGSIDGPLSQRRLTASHGKEFRELPLSSRITWTQSMEHLIT
ncbi:hypothetical protein HAX54_027282, partial [Datura stramonium]|nr:hypothetical protein [Datura stramonium]